ncbi:hypothetical protein RRF57_007651 [Xylaria bambusicola]|uniref:Hydrophobin n=1 Tax=Xylaria bambusicola TaxID=326684 RepID=A0AAN7Z6G6_9PEZI
MYLISTIAMFLLGTALSAPTTEMARDMTRVYFTCNSTQASGFSPSCCTDINGQVGINCIGAHLMGVYDPMYSCNLYVYNITGCCQTIGYKNPYTNNSLSVCAMSIDPI